MIGLIDGLFPALELLHAVWYLNLRLYSLNVRNHVCNYVAMSLLILLEVLSLSVLVHCLLIFESVIFVPNQRSCDLWFNSLAVERIK